MLGYPEQDRLNGKFWKICAGLLACTGRSYLIPAIRAEKEYFHEIYLVSLFNVLKMLADTLNIYFLETQLFNTLIHFLL